MRLIFFFYLIFSRHFNQCYSIFQRGIPIVSAFGLLGNFLSLLVLTKEKMHKSLTKMEISAHIGLIALAVSDLLFCFMVLLATTLPFQVRH